MLTGPSAFGHEVANNGRSTHDLWHLPAPPGVGSVRAMKEPTTRQQLLRARRYLFLLGLAGPLGLEAFVYFDLHHHTSLEMPVFLVIFGMFIALGASIGNALRCPNCALHLNRFYNNEAGRDLHFCPKCDANFNAPLPAVRPLRAAA